MGALGAWLVSLGWPIVSRVLLSLGLGAVSYVGVSAALGVALNAAKGSLSGMSADLTALLAIAGVFQSFAIMAGGLIAGVGLMALKKISFTNSGT